MAGVASLRLLGRSFFHRTVRRWRGSLQRACGASGDLLIVIPVDLLFTVKSLGGGACFDAPAALLAMGYFYIITNAHHNVLYCGATNDLYSRVMQHRSGFYLKSFSKRYNVCKLVYFESFTNTADAFAREKQVKGGSRKKKIQLIESINPGWRDLFDDFLRSL